MLVVLLVGAGCATYRFEDEPQADGGTAVRVFGRGTTTIDIAVDGTRQVTVDTSKANVLDKAALVGSYVLDAASGALSRMGLSFEK